MARFHHRRLPAFSTLLAGRVPLDDVGFTSERLQIWYNHTERAWRDPAPHVHERSDECFIVLAGRLVVEVEGERHEIGPSEFCCFPAGVFHWIVEVYPPAETLMIRAPSCDDKLYPPDPTPDDAQD
jgi:mannose-6-phosphate isomerase-like protein (cupin superfamily)